MPKQDLGSLVRVEEMEDLVAHGAVLATKQRRVVASEAIRTGTIIHEGEPMLAIVEK